MLSIEFTERLPSAGAQADSKQVMAKSTVKILFNSKSFFLLSFIRRAVSREAKDRRNRIQLHLR